MTEARKRIKGLSLSTVYASLNELSRQGIIEMLEFDKMENRFEGDLTDRVNLICKNYNKIKDFELPISIDPKEVYQTAHFRVSDTRLDF
jgi:Fe2+ or Zn2+ uptake regulation protein